MSTLSAVSSEVEKAFNKFAKSIKKPLTAIQKIKQATFKNMTKAFTAMKQVPAGIVSRIRDIINKFIDFGAVIDALSLIFEPFNVLIKLFAAGITESLAPVIQELFTVLLDPEIVALMRLLGQIVGEALVIAIRIFIAAINALKETGVLDFLLGLLQSVMDGLTWFADNLDVVWNEIITGFESVVSFFVNGWNGFMNAMNIIGESFSAAWSYIEVIWNAILSVFGAGGVIFEAFGTLFTSAWAGLETIWNAIVNAFTSFKNIFSSIWNALSTVWTAITGGFSGFKTAFDTIRTAFTGVWNAILDGFESFGEVLSAIWSGIVSMFTNFVNFFIGIINAVVDALNAADVFDVVEDIPKLSPIGAQTGAFIRRGGIVRVHDREAILNRQQTQNMFNNNNSRNITITFEKPILMDEDSAVKIGREVQRAMIRAQS